jgi:tetratricopeptide (TPR) repeat protein
MKLNTKQLLGTTALLTCFASNGAFAEDLSKCIVGWRSTEAGNHLDAVAHFQACIAQGQLTDSSLARTYRNIGIAYRRAKEPMKAIEAYDKAIALKPGDVASDYINRANAYDEANMFKEAMADYDKALELKPGFGEIFYNRGISYERQQMREQAKAEFIAAYEHGLRSPGLYERFVVYGLIKPSQQ